MHVASEKAYDEPRLSAAIIIPSLYLMARTDVPVTIGCLSRFKIKKCKRHLERTVCVARHHYMLKLKIVYAHGYGGDTLRSCQNCHISMKILSVST
jgi:hypothetical protein